MSPCQRKARLDGLRADRFTAVGHVARLQLAIDYLLDRGYPPACIAVHTLLTERDLQRRRADEIGEEIAKAERGRVA